MDSKIRYVLYIAVIVVALAFAINKPEKDNKSPTKTHDFKPLPILSSGQAKPLVPVGTQKDVKSKAAVDRPARLFIVTPLNGSQANEPFDIKIVALTEDNRIARNARGLVYLHIDDPAAQYKPVHAFDERDKGVITVKDIILPNYGRYTLTAVSIIEGNRIESKRNIYAGRDILSGPLPKRLGDLNGNGAIDTSDIELMTKILLDLKEGKHINYINQFQRIAGDLDKDSHITEADLVLLQEKITEPPPQDTTAPQIQLYTWYFPFRNRRIPMYVWFYDGESGVDVSSLYVFSDRGASGFVSPGRNILKKVPVRFYYEMYATFTIPEDAFDIGKNIIAAVIMDKAGNITVDMVELNVSGIQVGRSCYPEPVVGGRNAVAIAFANLPSGAELSQVNWSFIEGYGGGIILSQDGLIAEFKTTSFEVTDVPLVGLRVDALALYCYYDYYCYPIRLGAAAAFQGTADITKPGKTLMHIDKVKPGETGEIAVTVKNPDPERYEVTTAEDKIDKITPPDGVKSEDVKVEEQKPTKDDLA